MSFRPAAYADSPIAQMHPHRPTEVNLWGLNRWAKCPKTGLCVFQKEYKHFI